MSTIKLLQDTATSAPLKESVVFEEETDAYSSRYRSSTYGVAQRTLYENAGNRVAVYGFDLTGALNFLQPVALFDEFILQSVIETNRDNVQLILGSDAPKLYSLGQGHRLFSVAATLLDTKLDRTIGQVAGQPQTPAEANLLRFKGWSGAGLNNWQTFYDTFSSLEACARNRTLVGLQYMNRRLYGAFTSVNISHSAAQPHMYALSAAFYATFVEAIL
jgi:hypothetical protein